MGKISRLILHPYFIALYPILFLLSINAGQIPLQNAGRGIVASLIFTLVLALLFGAIFKDWHRGGFLTTVFLALFFSYGHVYNWLQANASFFASHAYLILLWCILLLSGIWFGYRAHNMAAITKYLNLILFFLLIQPAASVGLFVYQHGISLTESDPLKNISDETAYRQDAPDIYYIILDGYGRSDVIKELYGYDNSPFINNLRQRGFYVADQSHSNYMQTALSLSSSLSYNYLDLTKVDPESKDRIWLNNQVRRSNLRNFLRKRGYQTVAFSTGYDVTSLEYSDIFFPLKDIGGFNNFEGLVLSTSMLSALNPAVQQRWFVDPFRCDNQREYILNVFESMNKVPDIPGPKFVLGHILAAHPQFVFGSEENESRTVCGLLDGDAYPGDVLEYRRSYVNQMKYMNDMVIKMVDMIIEKSTEPPVILIQGDHGSGMFLDWDSSERTCLRERFSILNAYYIPGVEENRLYETITPVNSFRVVLNELFDTNLPLLEDRNYFSRWDTPYQLEEVTGKVNSPCSESRP